MKKLLTISLLFLATYVNAQYMPRQDKIWARSTAGEPITLDGVLNESAWAKAESLQIIYGVVGTIPTSGYRSENNPDGITDPTHATVKFLTNNNQLYIAFVIPDSSIGGGPTGSAWPFWDGILMSVKNAKSSTRPTPAVEIFPTFLFTGDSVGAPFKLGYDGKYRDKAPAAQLARWDAAVKIHGTSNDDSTPDTSWIVEMKINLDSVGYHATAPGGDVIALNFSIWDQDWYFTKNAQKMSSERTWWQAPWGNSNGPNFGRVYVEPEVTINSGVIPEVLPDGIIPNGAGLPDPVIDGELDEASWAGAYTFNIAWGDSLLRTTYPSIGPLASGQWQPELVTGSKPPVLDPSFATIKIFFKDDYLYLGADVNDMLIQGLDNYDQVDGLGLILADRGTFDENEHTPVTKLLRMNFAADGLLHGFDALAPLIDSGATIAAKLKGTSTINVNSDIDEGYKIEMKLDLKKLGYPTGLGDKLIFAGVDLYDGDSFDDAAKNYGTRTWWFREHAGGPALAWLEMDPSKLTDVDKDISVSIPSTIELRGNYPNPFNPITSIQYSIPQSGKVGLIVYNNLGQQVSRIKISDQAAGTHDYSFNGAGLSSGIYFYQLILQSVEGKSFESKVGKMILIK
ncbi:MAG: T9SS type A sorting domain-containing protein [Ignavibacteriales bacterium]|nr:T9SS type A sorting domain-containing protein [Ignavibacteriales bacterium]